MNTASTPVGIAVPKAVSQTAGGRSGTARQVKRATADTAAKSNPAHLLGNPNGGRFFTQNPKKPNQIFSQLSIYSPFA